jgi:hypothetical protein
MVDSQSGTRDIWVEDLTRDILSRLGPGQFPVWSADSKRIVFASALESNLESNLPDILERNADGSGREEVVSRSHRTVAIMGSAHAMIAEDAGDHWQKWESPPLPRK